MNFDFLKDNKDFEKLYKNCAEAETFVLTYPNISAASARKALEFLVKLIYSSHLGEYAAQGLSVFEIISDPYFIDFIGDSTVITTIHYIRKICNRAVHDDDITADEAMSVLEQLHFFVGESMILLGVTDDYPIFEKPGVVPVAAPKVEPKAEEQKVEKIEKLEKVEVAPEIIAKFAPRMRHAKFDVKYMRNEEENKRLYLISALREAGWPIVNTDNQAMPCSVGVNIDLGNGDVADYVLYGKDNRPLAVVEYRTTIQNPVAGRRKALEQAEKLSVKCGYKPIVYHTDGYNIFVIDQLGYKPRRVFQFHTLEELELLKLRVGIRQDISDPVIDDKITNRTYQKEAITATCRAFMENRRRSLLVMATGTGKTRISISLVDILMKANWIKNVLFLADRTSLVRQAHKNFNKLLPNITTSIYSGYSTDRDPNARVIFATYQTMINLINDDTREFSIGRFDLIIVDEAHRSIFKKYSALFNYFDALMVGLTATPRAEDNKSTYQMFELQNGHPDYAYELEQAIKEGYLVGFSVLDKTPETYRRGIRYDDLSDEEKQSFEDAFATGDNEGNDLSGMTLSGQEVAGSKIINLGTIDAMLNDVMMNGLKVDGGDKIGKTVIFASSHTEAVKIVERFQRIYSHLGPDFCKLIDSQTVNNLTVIDNFGERDKLPQVAVSVDMMDTGIDVPDVLNLVFFKKVSSKIKFLQMVGRGTRLSPDIFGSGMDKKGFLIFDYQDNFRYFNSRNTWTTVDEESNGKFGGKFVSQSQLIDRTKLGILSNLIEINPASGFDLQYKDSLKEYFLSTTRDLCNDNVEVQYNMPIVNKYRTAEQWDRLSEAKIQEIEEHLLPLFPPIPAPARAKTFDLMIYFIEYQVPLRSLSASNVRKIRFGFGNVGNKIDEMIVELLKIKTIPEITQKESLLLQMRHANMLFEDFSLEKCEMVRLELRELMKYIPRKAGTKIIDVRDVIGSFGSSGITVQNQSYADKATEYISKGDPLILKIANLEELTTSEKEQLKEVFESRLGSAADYATWSNGSPLLPFIRSKTGIREEAIESKFGSFLNSKELNPQQLAYLNQIIAYASENGDIAFQDLQRVSPFCDVDIMSLFGQKIVHIKTLITGLHKPVME